MAMAVWVLAGNDAEIPNEHVPRSLCRTSGNAMGWVQWPL